MSIKKVAFLSYLFCLCGFILLMGVTVSHAENLYVNGLARVERYSWPSAGEGLELAYNPYINKGYIQVYDRNYRSWGSLYLGNGIVGVGRTSSPTQSAKKFYSILGNGTGYAIYGENTYNSTDLGCIGVYGKGGRGVYGYSPNGIGTAGDSAFGIGVEGFSGSSGIGVKGYSHTSIGGWFESLNGTAIYAKGGSSGYAGEFDGRIKTTSVEITNGADLSENFEIQQMKENLLPSPGMVVSIDPENPGALAVSKKAYDRKVAGVISGAGGLNPGMLMGQKDSKADGAFPVALTGRVYCYVDASYGCIEPGDLLTTSETPGYAMKAADYTKAQGTILGKAMTELKDGKGLVLTLINLQ